MYSVSAPRRRRALVSLTLTKELLGDLFVRQASGELVGLAPSSPRTQRAEAGVLWGQQAGDGGPYGQRPLAQQDSPRGHHHGRGKAALQSMTTTPGFIAGPGSSAGGDGGYNAQQAAFGEAGGGALAFGFAGGLNTPRTGGYQGQQQVVGGAFSPWWGANAHGPTHGIGLAR